MKPLRRVRIEVAVTRVVYMNIVDENEKIDGQIHDQTLEVLSAEEAAWACTVARHDSTPGAAAEVVRVVAVDDRAVEEYAKRYQLRPGFILKCDCGGAQAGHSVYGKNECHVSIK